VRVCVCARVCVCVCVCGVCVLNDLLKCVKRLGFDYKVEYVCVRVYVCERVSNSHFIHLSVYARVCLCACGLCLFACILSEPIVCVCYPGRVSLEVALLVYWSQNVGKNGLVSERRIYPSYGCSSAFKSRLSDSPGDFDNWIQK
jgi:hypothetical protein